QLPSKIDIKMTGMPKDSITKDMVMQILLKLPVKSILRFRCASKSWNSLITSPGFMKNHLDKAKQLLLLRTENPVVSYSLHLDNDRVDMCSRLEFPIPNEAGLFDFIGCCNGVACLSSQYLQIDSSRRLVLWNPSIRKTLDLPAPSSWAAIDKTLLGLGYDAQSDDYKVARVVRLKGPEYADERPFAFQFYSLNSGSWNENADVSSSLANEDTLRSITLHGFGNPAIVNGVIHWLLHPRENNGMLALSFDLSNNSFGELMLPECFDPTERMAAMSISVFKDSLSFNVLKDYGGNYVCEVWLMNQYGARESWDKQYRIEMLDIARPVVFRSNGEILMAGYANSQLVSCDPQTREIHDMGLEVLLDDYADYFVESLALLDRSN
ncbi:F-box protein CPR30-like, partial [Populus alba x Populus x berolinensis]